MKRVLVIGANGQLGTELVSALKEKLGSTNVIASDITQEEHHEEDTIFEILDVKNKVHLTELETQYEIKQIYHLAAI